MASVASTARPQFGHAAPAAAPSKGWPHVKQIPALASTALPQLEQKVPSGFTIRRAMVLRSLVSVVGQELPGWLASGGRLPRLRDAERGHRDDLRDVRR